MRDSFKLQLLLGSCAAAAVVFWLRRRRAAKLTPFRARPGQRYYVVIDFECTCERDAREFQHEIIEFPAVFVNADSLEIDVEFHRYVRPTEHARLTTFCTELTGIAQRTVDRAEPLAAVLSAFDAFLGEHGFLDCDFVICTDGPWDILSFLRQEVQRKSIELPKYWQRFADVRQCFSVAFRTRRAGVKQMLETRGLSFQGRPHSGIDDARNIARLAVEVLKAGCELTTEPWEYRSYRPRNIKWLSR